MMFAFHIFLCLLRLLPPPPPPPFGKKIKNKKNKDSFTATRLHENVDAMGARIDLVRGLSWPLGDTDYP